MSFDIPVVSTVLPGNSGTVEDGQARKGLRELFVPFVGAMLLAAVSWAAENVGLVSTTFEVDETVIITIIAFAGSMFGWRTFRP